MRVHFPGGRNSSFYIIDDSSSGVCLFVCLFGSGEVLFFLCV